MVAERRLRPQSGLPAQVPTAEIAGMDRELPGAALLAPGRVPCFALALTIAAHGAAGAEARVEYYPVPGHGELRLLVTAEMAIAIPLHRGCEHGAHHARDAARQPRIRDDRDGLLA